jgi:hypothetical protein
MNPPAPRVVLKNHTLRDALIAGLVALLILGVLIYGMAHVSQKPKGNTLTGRIIAKEFIPLKEQMVEFSGRRLKGTRESDGEYVFKVQVDSEAGRMFDVPVTKGLYQTKREGDSLTFVRPRDEQH